MVLQLQRARDRGVPRHRLQGGSQQGAQEPPRRVLCIVNDISNEHPFTDKNTLLSNSQLYSSVCQKRGYVSTTLVRKIFLSSEGDVD